MKRFFPLLPTLMTIMAISAYAEIKDITWTLGPNMPEFRKGGCGAALDGKVISVFGMRQPWGEMDTMYIYDPVSHWWSRGPNGPVGQCYVQGTECDDAFYSVGGRKGKVRTECYRLSKSNDSYKWDQIPDLNESRGWAPSVCVASTLYVFGGAKSGRGPYDKQCRSAGHQRSKRNVENHYRDSRTITGLAGRGCG